MKSKAETASFDTTDLIEQESEVTTRIGVGVFASSDGAATADTGKSAIKLRSSSIVLGVVIIAAVVGLFSMRTLAKVTAVVSGGNEMERVIEDFLNSSAGRNVFQLNTSAGNAVIQSNEVLEVLNEAYTERQVALTNVQKDPFVLLNEKKPQEAVAAAPDNSVNELERQRSQRKQQLNTIASRLELKSVMLGSVPLANINGQIVRAGEIITIMPERQEFEVLSIENESVRLAAADLSLGVRIEIEIAINREQSGSGRKR